MSLRGIGLVVLGVAVMALRRWVVREHQSYLRRHYRDTAGYRAYLRLFEDERKSVLVVGFAGVAMLIAGIMFLAMDF